MTTQRPEPSIVDVIRWVAKQMNLPEDSTAQEISAVFLRALPGQDFVPPEPRHQAALLLVPLQGPNPRLPGDFPFLRLREEDLRSEVEEFALEFFHIPLSERRRRWQKLCGRCARSVSLSARLTVLESGLAVQWHPSWNERSYVGRLACHICDLFVLRPSERALQRHELLADMEIDLANWEKAAQELRRHYGRLAALEPCLIEQLVNGSKRRRGRRTKTNILLANLWWIFLVVSLGFIFIYWSIRFWENPNRSAGITEKSHPRKDPPQRVDWEQIHQDAILEAERSLNRQEVILRRQVGDRVWEEKYKKLFEEARQRIRLTPNPFAPGLQPNRQNINFPQEGGGKVPARPDPPGKMHP